MSPAHLLANEEKTDIVHLVHRHVALLNLVHKVVAKVGDQG